MDRAGGRVAEGRASGAAAEGVRRFEQLVRQFRPDLYRYALHLCREAPLAEDLVQEALLRAWRSLASLEDFAAAKYWLKTILRREYARTFERKWLPTVDIDALGAEEVALAAETLDPDVLTLRRALRELAADYREPLVLQSLLGHSTRDVGRMLGLTQQAVLTRLFRARRKLAAALEAPLGAAAPS